jgi:hypothetical protein
MLVRIPAKYRKIVETKWFDPTNQKVLESPTRASLQTLFKIPNEQEITLVPYKGAYPNMEHSLLSYEDGVLHNSGIYELGVKKKWMEYKPAKDDQIVKSELIESFQYAMLPKQIDVRMEKAFPKQQKYTNEQIQSVLDAWPFFENVYELCEKAKEAVKDGDKERARNYLESLKKNLEAVTTSKNKGEEWATSIRRFKDDLASAVKDMSKQTWKTLEQTYIRDIEQRQQDRRQGGFRQSYLFRKYPGTYYVFETEDGANSEPARHEPSAPPFNEPSRNTPSLNIPSFSSVLPSITTVTMQLGNMSFNLDRGIPAYSRRSDYFLRNQGKLTKDEQSVLDAIGIDKEMESRLKAYLPKFFDVLPDCQTDASLYLSKTCEVPYFVVWSTKFAERHQTLTRIQEATADIQPMSDYDTAITQSIVSEMKAKVTDIDQLFILIRLGRNEPTNAQQAFQIEDLFVLRRI